VEESSAVFSLVYTLAMCSVLAEMSEASTISPFLGNHFSMLDFPVTVFCFHLPDIFLKNIKLFQG